MDAALPTWWKCRECGERIDSRISIGDHYEREHGYVYSSPKAASTGSGEPKGMPQPSLAALPSTVSQPIASVLESPEFARRVFIQVAVWVPADRVGIVVRAALEARAELEGKA